MSLLRLALVVAAATAAKKPPPKRVALVSFAAPWDYGPYAHQLRELAEHWLATHHVVWIGLSGTVDRIQYGAPKISPLVGYRGAGMSKDPVKKVSKLNRIFVLTQRPFPHVSELQHHEDGVDATVAPSTRPSERLRVFRDCLVPRRKRKRSTSRSRCVI